MVSVGALPAIALLVGVAWGAFSNIPAAGFLWVLPPLCAAAVVSWRRAASSATLTVVAAAFCAAGVARSADARAQALAPQLRSVLHDELGGFAIDDPGPGGDHDPVVVRAILTEDAAPRDGFVSLRGNVVELAFRGEWRPAGGGVALTVGGSASAERALEWRAGRVIHAPVTFRRPARYLNEGVPNFERDLALDGITLFGSIKSALVVEVFGRGSAVEEASADLRAHIRRVIAKRIAPRDAVAAGIVTAVLIGDRNGLPDEVRDRLQAAGTYHVIAISGGNIAIVAATVLLALMLCGIRGRAASIVVMLVLTGYAQVVTAGPSVWRATLMAMLYFAARTVDLRTPPWHATAVAAGLMVVLHPLDVCDPGFVLTFGATAALLEGARRGRRLRSGPWPAAWLFASVASSLAVEVALLPVSAQLFSRVTCAGLVLNLLAVPLMGAAQVAGLAVVIFDEIDSVAAPAALCAYAGAASLVGSARLVDLAPWLTARVAPPGAAVVLTYYAGLATVVLGRRHLLRVAGGITVAAAVTLIAGAIDLPRLVSLRAEPPGLRLTALDVGQGEAMLLQWPAGGAMLVDAGGAPFGSGSFDIGRRVVTPAVWARGLRTLEAILFTHGDPDHLGGVLTVLEDLRPHEIWEGIRVPRHVPARDVLAAAAAAGIGVVTRRAGEAITTGGVRIRVLHPPEPDWERQRVRNDDSVVLEIVYGDVALLLTGDVSAEIERLLLPQLTHARVRVLKVGHHGSRTSTSRELLEHWRPQIAVISCGRGNTFGHPAREVLQRLDSIGATVFRTDVHGQITIETDGHSVHTRTYLATAQGTEMWGKREH